MGYADRAKQNEYARNWLAQRRADFFADKVCVGCGGAEDLELHHRDPAEKVSHKIWSWREERRLAELAKCEVRCHDCHLKRHAAKHGSRRRYDVHGCRCALCRAWKREHRLRYARAT